MEIVTAPYNRLRVPSILFILTSENWDVWKSYIQPLPSELTWTQIPWVTTFSEGINLARVQKKPLLLWVMNGHPLGCT